MTPPGRPLLPAVVGPLASAVIAREFGGAIEELASKYERAGSADAGRQLRSAVAQMRESARLRNVAQREIGDSGTTDVPKTATRASSSCPPSPGLTTQEVAEQLRVDVRTVTGWCKDEELPATRGKGRGRPWLIAEADLIDYLDRRGH